MTCDECKKEVICQFGFADDTSKHFCSRSCLKIYTKRHKSVVLNPDCSVAIRSIQLPYGVTEADVWVNLTTELAKAVHTNAVGHGFYPDDTRNDAECIALMHSELSEALEALRHGNGPGEHTPEFSALEEELADCVIRIFDFAGWKNLRLAEAVLAKHEFNKNRPPKHGKKF